MQYSTYVSNRSLYLGRSKDYRIHFRNIQQDISDACLQSEISGASVKCVSICCFYELWRKQQWLWVCNNCYKVCDILPISRISSYPHPPNPKDLRKLDPLAYLAANIFHADKLSTERGKLRNRRENYYCVRWFQQNGKGHTTIIRRWQRL